MAYNRNNYLRRVAHIVAVYSKVKHHDVPDTFILRHEFPKHNIYLSYRAWMNIKNMKQSEIMPKQLSLFDN